jgi:DNA polymerase-1
MTKVYDTILIDGNSIGHAHNRANKLTVGEFQTQAIFGFVKTMAAIKRQHPTASILVLWDGHAEWRKKILPTYKENRKALTPEDEAIKAAYKAQLPLIEKALQALGIRQMRVTSAEADDMAGLFSKRLSAQGKHVLLITGDRDWLQLVNEYVTWFDPVNDRTVDKSNFFEFTGFMTARAYLEGKALMGDTSDCVAGIDGIGEKGAQNLLAEHGSIVHFFKKIDAGIIAPKTRKSKTAKSPHPEQVLASDEGRAIFRRNVMLMNLQDVPNPPPEDVIVTTPNFNPDLFRKLCERLAFVSILKDFSGFIRTFQGV